MDFADIVAKINEKGVTSFFELVVAAPELFEALWPHGRRLADVPKFGRRVSWPDLWREWTDPEVKRALKSLDRSSASEGRARASLYRHCRLERRHLLKRVGKKGKYGFEDTSYVERAAPLFIQIIENLAEAEGVAPRTVWEGHPKLARAVKDAKATDGVFDHFGWGKSKLRCGRKPKARKDVEPGEETFKALFEIVGLNGRRGFHSVEERAGRPFMLKVAASLKMFGFTNVERDALFRMLSGLPLTVRDVWLAESEGLRALWKVLLLDNAFFRHHRANLLAVAERCPVFLRAGFAAGLVYADLVGGEGFAVVVAQTGAFPQL